jgi:hypothetical protein
MATLFLSLLFLHPSPLSPVAVESCSIAKPCDRGITLERRGAEPGGEIKREGGERERRGEMREGERG